jgi:hypothetical protein
MHQCGHAAALTLYAVGKKTRRDGTRRASFLVPACRLDLAFLEELRRRTARMLVLLGALVARVQERFLSVEGRRKTSL